MKIHISINLTVNRLVRNFILVDLFLLAGWGLVQPIFSIYVIEQVATATVVTVGIAAGIYWVLRSVLQIPIARMLDRTAGEEDDLRALILGLLLAGFAALLFGFVRYPWQLYLVEIIHATAFALYAASWPAIFSRHLDKDKVSFDWALDSTAAGIAAGISGFAGGMLVNAFGFSSVFILASIFSLIAAFTLIIFPSIILPPKTSSESAVRDHSVPGATPS